MWSSLSRYGGNLILVQLLGYHTFFFHNTLALICILSSTPKAACKCTGFVHCTSSQHVECLLRCCWARLSNDRPQQWLNMLRSPKISQRLMLNHGWESLDTLGTARGWAQHVERCCANALDFVEPRMDDRETRKILSSVELRLWPVSNLNQQDSTPLNRVFKCAQLVELNMLTACTVDKSIAFARSLKNET